ncbi:superoxide dismutase family protein [Sphingomonas sp. G-3-2-10]|uniref:superoxide dismutase family protein n=1 Tax=Sphingomonas sp. G-3-2-10 TaxID=2728838 RepID=UPI00146B41A4|nr:superoxide dismutase family protein [Sphingomonas sp. G-3-2-10]NML04191.1 superoxide dismutase family protein [Sphingomonas sp. G-3-2-10]
MTALRIGAAVVVLAGLGACTAQDEARPESGGRYAAGSFVAEALLKTAEGADAGKAWVKQKDGDLVVSMEVTGVSPGLHGVHIHTTGKCEAPGFTTAGGHWNPSGHQHGSMNPAGPHVGDIPNLTVGADGKGKLSFTLPGGAFEDLLDEDGAAFVVHAGPDDLKTDPAGNSGARIACGVFAAK